MDNINGVIATVIMMEYPIGSGDDEIAMTALRTDNGDAMATGTVGIAIVVMTTTILIAVIVATAITTGTGTAGMATAVTAATTMLS
jgi:hypothetical protein